MQCHLPIVFGYCRAPAVTLVPFPGSCPGFTNSSTPTRDTTILASRAPVNNKKNRGASLFLYSYRRGGGETMGSEKAEGFI